MSDEDVNAGRVGGGKPEPSPQDSGTGELSEEEIIKTLQIAQLEERLKKELERIQKEKEELERKKESAKDAIFKEMEEKYSLTEEEFRDAFRDIAHKEEIEKKIMDTIRERGRNAYEDIKDDMERIKRISIIENIEDKDIKTIAVYIKEAQAFIEEKQIEQGSKQIHHAGRLSKESIEIMKYIKENGCRIREKEVLSWAKETLGISSDLFNKRRWSLFQRGYIKREESDLIITEAGLARLREEGY